MSTILWKPFLKPFINFYRLQQTGADFYKPIRRLFTDHFNTVLQAFAVFCRTFFKPAQTVYRSRQIQISTIMMSGPICLMSL